MGLTWSNLQKNKPVKQNPKVTEVVVDWLLSDQLFGHSWYLADNGSRWP